MPAARIPAGDLPFSPVVPRLMPAAPEDFGFNENLLTLDVEEVFRLVYRVSGFALAYSISGEVMDGNAGTRTVYSGSGTILCRRYFVRAIGEGLDFFTRVQYFASDFGQNQNSTFADTIGHTMAALGSEGFNNLSLPFTRPRGLRLVVRDLETNDLIDDYQQDVGYLLTGRQASGDLGYGGAFFVKTWPTVVFPLQASGSEISDQSAPATTRRRTGRFLGRAFDFYTRPEITVTLTLTALNDLPF